MPSADVELTNHVAAGFVGNKSDKPTFISAELSPPASLLLQPIELSNWWSKFRAFTRCFMDDNDAQGKQGDQWHDLDGHKLAQAGAWSDIIQIPKD